MIVYVEMMIIKKNVKHLNMNMIAYVIMNILKKFVNQLNIIVYVIIKMLLKIVRFKIM